MNSNPYWVGFVCALSRYPGVQRLARMAQEREREKLRREWLSHGREGVLESGLCLPDFAQMATAQQTVKIGEDLKKDLERVRKQWKGSPFSLSRPIGRQRAQPKLPRIPVGERTEDGKVTFLLRADIEGELNTGLEVRRGQHLSISVAGTCPLSTTLLVNPGGIEMRKGHVHGNPIVRPDATYPHVPCGSVVARLPSTRAWPVRGKWEGPAPASGDLHLAINDVPRHYKDNRGTQGEIVVLAVTVETL